ncbi:MAG: helix-turn-helix transcriptional regulator [Bacteroidetes bacterium]|nr:helix-turn-helix transcriptional regulator [Bacteroidota bacterium]
MPKFEFEGKTYNNPVELSLDIIGGKWKMPILWRLSRKVWRYGELKKDVGQITHKMLTQQLKELEKCGLIKRKVFAVVPPKVEYSLTKKGKTTIPLIKSLRKWGDNYRKEKQQQI